MKKWFWKIVLAASLIVMVVALINIVSLTLEYQKGIHTYQKLEEYVEVEEPSDAINATQPEENVQEAESVIPVDLNVNFEGLAAINDDVVGWIYYEPLDISYPIVRGDDNDYYTHYTFENEQNSSGAIFMDFLNRPDFSDFNTIIYGHNMRNGTMFGSLKKLLNDTTQLEENPYFYIFTEDKALMYEICSAYITTESSHTYDLIQTLEEKQDFIDYMKQVSVYFWSNPLFDTDVQDDTRLVTLSTCHGLHSKNRTVIHGVLIAEENR